MMEGHVCLMFRCNTVKSRRVQNKSLVWLIYFTDEVKWMFNIRENESEGLPKPKVERVTFRNFLLKRKVFLDETISNHNECTMNRLFGYITLPVK